ncbi:MAG: glycosyltransferase [Rhodothermales bacterium]|nr:glycosyltransferase [Rhodothermales bacterium]MBO6779000.1 glycosyltransferase [Rhodothermales bacterium]
MATLYAIALAVVTLYGLNHFWLSWRWAKTRALVPGPVPDPAATLAGDGPVPMVTVQIPLYNESLVADRVIAACARLDWPRDRLEIQVLDDSTDETTGVVARAVRFWRAQGMQMVHLHRTHRNGFKAGALAAGLRSARGGFIAMFDADFVPPRDFLRRMMPRFSDPQVGFVQARWAHLNDSNSLLTRMQSVGLDAHFALEQEARARSGYPAGFNGTAGIWRLACIEDAGGWSADTLTEDLDLSYRAQLRGWRMAFLPELAVPAELPVEMGGFRAQQHRWTKGAMQTAMKLVRRVRKGGSGVGFRTQGTLHLTATLGFPFMLVVALLHAPVSLRKAAGAGPSEAFFALLTLGIAGFAGFFLAHLLAQRSLYGDWARRLVRFPLFLAASIGMSLSNTIAVAEALLGRRSPFVRTPKFNSLDNASSPWWRSAYAVARLGPVSFAEVMLAVYLTVGLFLLVWVGAWASVPFQLLFVAGTWMVVGLTLRDAGLVGKFLRA